jgi:hypothetical protein
MEKEKIAQIRKLIEDGKTLVAISKELNIPKCTIYYHTSESYRKKKLAKSNAWFQSLPIEKRRIIYKKRVPYQRQYHRNRYQSDEVFRKKTIALVRKSQSKPMGELKGGLKK